MIISRSAHRKLTLLLVLPLAACAAEGPIRGTPAPRDARISVEPLLAGDRMTAGRLLRVESSDGDKPPPDGTVELFLDSRSYGGEGSGGATEDESLCNRPTLLTILPCSFVAVGTLTAVFAVALTAPVWGVPYALATEELGDKSGDRTRRTAARARIESGGNRNEGGEAGREHTALAAGVGKAIAENGFESRLDEAFAATLARTLGGHPPAPDETTPGVPGTHRADIRILAGLSHLSLAGTPQRDASLTLCSRAMVSGGASGWRYFRTCLSKKVFPDQYENAEWLQSALLAQSQQLALSMAGALRAE